MIDLHDPATLFFFLVAAVMTVSGFFFFGREIVARGRQLDREREELEKLKRRRGGI